MREKVGEDGVMEEVLELELQRLTDENRALRVQLQRLGGTETSSLPDGFVSSRLVTGSSEIVKDTQATGKALHLLLDELPFGVCCWSDKLECIYFDVYNESSSAVLSKELFSMKDSELRQVFPETKRLRAMKESILRGSSCAEKQDFHVKNGEKTSLLSVLCMPLLCPTSPSRVQGVLMILVDRTSQAATEAKFAQMKAESEQWERTEQKLRHAIKNADEAIEAKNTFLAVMSHEIRTPLNGVLGTAQLLATTPLDAEQKELVDAMVFSGDVLLALINDVLDLSKIESGTIKLEEREYNPRNIIKQVVRTATAAMKDRGIKVQVDIADDVPAIVIGDPLRLKQIINNLVSNAVKFTREGHVGVRLKVLQGDVSQGLERVKPRDKLEVIHEDMTWENQSIMLQFAIDDSGIGIPEESFPFLFDKFTQVHSSTTRKYGGTGLGLAICKQLVELMGGQITVSSRVGKGSTFTFTLSCKCIGPASKDEVDRHVGETSLQSSLIAHLHKLQTGLSLISSPGRGIHSAISCPLSVLKSSRRVSSRSKTESGTLRRTSSGPPRIDCSLMADVEEPRKLHLCSSSTGDEIRPSLLLAEDNKVNVMVALSMLKRLGLSADVALDGQEALKAIQTKKYDLVLMDICMPVLDGLEVTRLVRRYERTGSWEETSSVTETKTEQTTRLPIVAMTANALSDCEKRCFEYGINSLVTKPITFKKLRNVLKLFLASSSSSSSKPEEKVSSQSSD